MKILSMTATFGRLNQAVLTPGPGLTVITAPNEAGKSTWTAFLTAMLYGIDTRERNRAGSLAAKHRYQPWSGAPMSGQLRVEWEGQDITIRRFTDRSGPFQGFEAVYTASGDPVPFLSSNNVGQTLLGVGREVFVRSALVGQNGAAVTAAPELEQRVAALATSGQEDVSFSATQRTLKDWRNRRQSNRTTGRIPQLEEELAHTKARLEEMEQARTRQQQAQTALRQLKHQRAELNFELQVHKRLAQKELNARLVQAQEALDLARAERETLPPPPQGFEGLTAQQALEQARSEEESSRLGRFQASQSAQRQAVQRRRGISVLWMTLLLLALAGGGVGLAFAGQSLRQPQLPWIGLGLGVLSLVVLLILVVRLRGYAQQLRQIDQLTPPPSQDTDLVDAANQYARWLDRRELLDQQVSHHQQRVADLKAQGAQPFSTLEYLHAPVHTQEEAQSLLEQAEQNIARWQSQLDQATGALQGDPLALESQRDALCQELAQRKAQLEALDIALAGLERANTILRERFSPALNQATAAYFSTLTGGRYRHLTLDRAFSADTWSQDNLDPHSALYLSGGTVDQLYLSVRLALCQLTLPGAPVVLDEALAAFDDTRAALALECLRRLGQERQVLLFSCHRREEAWAAANGVPVLSLDTPAAP
ncbi:MAG TPA: hypothetical protein DIT49_06630 [Clostridiales bacterium]|nr:hypothetical protein [Clostridiales bacterium]